jgi:alkanesulfonate monooxygenase SsuD/methylene tetrahydromethanopterin reductase-like flavin-dependent oxidoreductase (luciferase family)
MQFGILYEHQLPRPWHDGDELRLFQEALDQVELADRLGIDFAWEVEHHFLEEFSHSSAPEVFLAACSQRTRRIRLGHGIVLMPPMYNHPARVAERIATLDLVSRGRVEFGTGESASRAEIEGFGVPISEKHDLWSEAVEQVCHMLAMEPYPGFEGRGFSMPCRNIVPKPVQKPHPPLWMACSNREAIRTAAQHGMGALTFAFVEPSEAKVWVEEYYDTLRRDCVPLGHAINAAVAVVTGFSCHESSAEARRRGLDGFQFFGYGIGHHYLFGTHKPGRTNVWERYEAARSMMPELGNRGLGNPEELRAHIRQFADAGVDQVVFIQQGGRNRHRHICESLELFARTVMPEFKAGEEERRRRKFDALSPFLEQAMRRKPPVMGIPDDRIPEYRAYGRSIVRSASSVFGSDPRNR